MLFTKPIMLILCLHVLSAFAAGPLQPPADPSQCPVLWGYARFGLIFKLYCGSTDPYIASGPWKQHPIKNWQSVTRIRTTSPRHGVDLESGTYDSLTFTQMLQSFQQDSDRMVQKLSALNNNEFNVPDDADVLRAHHEAIDMRDEKKPRPHLPGAPACSVSLEGNKFNYNNRCAPIPPYDYNFYEGMRQHWTNFQYLAYTTDLNVEATRKQYAMLGVLASFSRGLVDSMINIEPTGRKSVVEDANGNKVPFEFDRDTLGLTSDRFLVRTNRTTRANKPLYENPPIVKNVLYHPRKARGYILDIEKFGGEISHKLSKYDHIVTRNSYDYWMGELRTRILQVVEFLRNEIANANQDQRCQVNPAHMAANNAVLQYWENTIQRLATINGANDACVLRKFAEDPRFPAKADTLALRKTQSIKAKQAPKDLKKWAKTQAKAARLNKIQELQSQGVVSSNPSYKAAIDESQKAFIFAKKHWYAVSPQNQNSFMIPPEYMVNLEKRLKIPTEDERKASTASTKQSALPIILNALMNYLSVSRNARRPIIGN